MNPVPLPASAAERVKRITFSDIEAEINRRSPAQPSGGTLAPPAIPAPVPAPAHTPSSSDNKCSRRPSINHCINNRYKSGQAPEPEPVPVPVSVSMTSHANEKPSNDLNTKGWIPRNEFQRKTFKNLQFDLRNFLTISITGTPIHEAYNTISDTIGEELRYKDCGFKRFEEFLFHCHEFLEVRTRTDGVSGYYLFLRGKSTKETEHMRELILEQKKNWVGFQATTQNTRAVPPGILLDSKIWKKIKFENENLPQKIIPNKTTSCDSNYGSGVKNNSTVNNNLNTAPVSERSSTKCANYFKGENIFYPRSCNNNNRNYNFQITDRFDRMVLDDDSTIANKTEAAAAVTKNLRGGGNSNGVTQHHHQYQYQQNLKFPWQPLKIGEKSISSKLLGVDGFGFFIIQTNDAEINEGFDSLQAFLGEMYTTCEERDKYRIKPSDMTEGILVGVFKGFGGSGETEKNYYFAIARIFDVNLEKNECTVITSEAHEFLVVPIDNIYRIRTHLTNFRPKVIMCSLDGLDEYMMTATAEIRKAFEKIPLPRSREVTVTVTAERGKFHVPSVIMSIKNDNINSEICSSNEKNYDVLELVKQYGIQNGYFQILKSQVDIEARKEFQKNLFYCLRSKQFLPE